MGHGTVWCDAQVYIVQVQSRMEVEEMRDRLREAGMRYLSGRIDIRYLGFGLWWCLGAVGVEEARLCTEYLESESGDDASVGVVSVPLWKF